MGIAATVEEAALGRRARSAHLGAAATAALCCVAAGGCGGSAHSSSASGQRARSAADRVCGAARSAAGTVLSSQVSVRIADPDPANVECLLNGGSYHVDLVAQASPRAWTQYDTTVVHQGQAYSGGVQQRTQLPRDMTGVGTNAAWIPAQSELVATNGTQSSGGSFLTVTVTRHPARGRASLPLARAVAIATLSVAPRGPNPGPPPS